MTLFSLFLLVHIVGAIGTGVIVLQSLFSVFKKDFSNHAFNTKALTISGFAQVLTGLGLVVTSSSPFVASCAKLGMYIVVITGTRFLLQYTANKYQKSPSV